VASRRRCALCFGLAHDLGVKPGQIAHIDQDPANNDPGNLVWLCLEHHDQYDSRTSQSKGLTADEVKHHRADLYSFNQSARARLEPSRPHTSFSPEAAILARFLNERSKNGHKFDPQERVQELPERLGLSEEDVEVAIDDLRDKGLVEQNGTRDFVFPLERLFWETDPLFSDSDPVVDAQEVARFVVAQDRDTVDFSVMAERLGWSPRRLNPAAMYLVDRGLADPRPALGSAPYSFVSLIRTTKTKRFVREL
jgi:hypothetical protein